MFNENACSGFPYKVPKITEGYSATPLTQHYREQLTGRHRFELTLANICQNMK